LPEVRTLRCMKTLTLLLGAAMVMSLAGCKKMAPEDIVRSSITSAMRTHASGLVSAMCGGPAQGLASPQVRVVSRIAGGTGTVHVSGKPTLYKGTATQCEGDIEYSFTYTTKTTGPSKKRKTMTTWYLSHMKLVAVQTPGVALKPFEEDPEGNMDDDAEP
jgi:uncharacterized Zn-binding protein involved in type VI secretion